MIVILAGAEERLGIQPGSAWIGAVFQYASIIAIGKIILGNLKIELVIEVQVRDSTWKNYVCIHDRITIIFKVLRRPRERVGAGDARRDYSPVTDRTGCRSIGPILVTALHISKNTLTGCSPATGQKTGLGVFTRAEPEACLPA